MVLSYEGRSTTGRKAGLPKEISDRVRSELFGLRESILNLMNDLREEG